jgi:hypothetical protein
MWCTDPVSSNIFTVFKIIVSFLKSLLATIYNAQSLDTIWNVEPTKETKIVSCYRNLVVKFTALLSIP